jgi:hypothetical protein
MRHQFAANDYSRHLVEANVTTAVVAGRRPMTLGNRPVLLSPNLGLRLALDEHLGSIPRPNRSSPENVNSVGPHRGSSQGTGVRL